MTYVIYFADSLASDVDRLVYGYDIIREAGLTPIPTEFIFCQAFKDKGGKGPIGKPFTKAPLGSQRFSTTRIYVGSVFCSDAAAVRAYVQSRPADGIPVVQFKPRPFVGLFFGGLTLNVFLDNSITLLTLANDVYSVGIFYTPITVTVSCQLYGDKQAKQKIGGPFFSHNVQEDATNLTEDPDFVATRVRAIRCRAVP